jgi:S1-C subfamily serine protease
VVPDGVRTLYGSLRTFLNQSGFPPVFGDLPSTSVVAVPPPPNLSPAVRRRVEVAAQSVFKIYGQAPRCNRGIEGSGFVYAPHRVVTNAHVVAGTDQVAVQVGRNHSLPATVVLFDPRVDIAVLNVPGLNAVPLPMSRSAAAQGTPAVVLGYPEDGPYTVRPARIRTQATVSGSDIYGHGTVDRRIYSVRSIIRSGNSGGPLMSYQGRVLGVVFATALDSSDTGYALTSGQVSGDIGKGRTATMPVSTGRCTPD